MPETDQSGSQQRRVVRPVEFEKPTTGSETVDRQIDQVAEYVLLRIQPILRDMLREELKRVLEACE